jgi:hypothetical protein
MFFAMQHALSCSPHCVLPRHGESVLDPALHRAYLDTNYHVKPLVGASFLLQVGSYSACLAQLYVDRRITCSTFITADNPLGLRLEESENRPRRQRLIQELDKRKLAWIPGVGQDPHHAWPAEHSLLVLGLGLDGARDLACRHDQNAVVWADTDAVPKLLLAR